jgi:NADPH-dependent 2,4-dienoyl-CoA reductase/sulfur reductase-like enzyme
VTLRRFGRRHFLALATAAAAGAVASWDCVAAAGARPKARVIIVGGGFAGASCALHLRSANPALEVTLVDPDDRYITCPMSNSVLVGLRALGSITVSRDALERRGVTLARDRVEAIDAQRRQVRLGRGATLAYDRLVMAPGIRFLWGQPQGYDEAAARVMPHAWQAGAQTEILAAQLRGIRSGGVVAISVPAGPMRCPPGPFERAGLMADFLKRRNPRAKILIFDANNHFPKQDLFTDAWQALYPGMIDWIPVVRDGAVVRVAPAEMTIYTSHDAHRADVINIIPPQAPALLAVEAGLASGHGWCPIDPQTFESTLIPYVHVIGDACIADPMPKAASAAHAQARQCARALAAAFAGAAPPPPAMDSVCYSLLAPGRALSIYARFATRDGMIESLAAAPDTVTASEQEEARNAASWYRRIIAESFAI